MDDPSVTILCYWNGRISSGLHGLTYDGANPEAIKVSNQLTYDELLDKMYHITSYEKRLVKLNIICRYPSSCMEYVLLPVKDRSTLNIVLDTAKRPGINCLEFYLEVNSDSTEKEGNQCLNDDSVSRLMTEDLQRNVRVESRHVSEELPLPIIVSRRCDAHSTEGVHVHVPNRMSDDLLEVNQTQIEEIIMSEEHDLFLNGMDVNNDLLNSEDERDFAEDEPDDEMGSYEGREYVNVINEEAPSSEFTSIEGIEKAIVDSSHYSSETSEKSYDGDLYVGQRFATKEHLQNAVKAFSIKVHQEYEVDYSTPSLWILKCKQAPQCPWRLRANIPKGKSFFLIRKYDGPHTCINPIINQDHVQLDSGFVANQIKALVKAQMSITLTAIQAEISDKFNYTISKKKAWLAKQKAIVELFGDWLDSYKLLPEYMEVLKQKNLGTIVHWDKEPRGGNSSEEIFNRVFWAFGASVEGFKYCRPVISIDGTFLYGKYKGTMLIAVSADANNQLFPLAFSIVEGENKDSWTWFMACIREYVTQRRGICVISDRHAGIMATMKQIGCGWTEPLAYHRFCIRHLASNFNETFKDKTLKDLVSIAARENQPRKFRKRMETIERINVEARRWLDKLPVEKWTLSHDGGKRYGMMTTNLSEIFNSVLKGARALPITSLVQLTFYRLNWYFAVRRQLAAQRILDGQSFTPYVDAKMISNGIKAGRHEVTLFNRAAGTFSVQTGRSPSNIRKGGHVQILDLNANSCSCQKWQINGFPCSHVLAACQHCSLDSKPLVQNFYSISTYEKTWAPPFHPIPDKAYWPPELVGELTLVPSDSMKRVEKGRRKSKRIPNEMDEKEGKGIVTCSVCKKSGHNQRTCPKKKEIRWLEGFLIFQVSNLFADFLTCLSISVFALLVSISTFWLPETLHNHPPEATESYNILEAALQGSSLQTEAGEKEISSAKSLLKYWPLMSYLLMIA